MKIFILLNGNFVVSHHDVHNLITLFFFTEPEDKSECDNPLQFYLDNIMELKERNNQDCAAFYFIRNLRQHESCHADFFPFRIA